MDRVHRRTIEHQMMMDVLQENVSQSAHTRSNEDIGDVLDLDPVM